MQRGEGPDDVMNFEIREDFGNRDRWAITLWAGRSTMGNVFPVTFATRERAEEVVAAIGDLIREDYAAQAEYEEQRRIEIDARIMAEGERRAATRALERRQLADEAATSDVIEVYQCGDCQHVEEDLGAFEEIPAYECGTCGQELVGEDGRRCDTCHRFTARLHEAIVCPGCEQVLTEEPKQVTGRMVGRQFIAEAEIEELS